MKKYIDEFIDFGHGQAFYPSGIHINYYKPLHKQVDILREDLFQVAYGNDSLNYVIDIGWYGRSFSTNGSFAVYLIKNANWHSPILRVKCKSIKRLIPAILLCLNRLKKETEDFALLPNA
jgi:hypothetical protein